MDQKNVLLGSWMFVPGNRQRMIEKSLGVPADAIMMDIEDGVAPAEKEIPSRFFKNSATPRPRSTGSAEIESFSKRLVPVPAFQHSRSPLPE